MSCACRKLALSSFWASSASSFSALFSESQKKCEETHSIPDCKNQAKAIETHVFNTATMQKHRATLLFLFYDIQQK